MLYKSLVVGVLFSIGIFAVKSGVGLAFMARPPGRPWARLLGFGLYAMAHALIIFSAAVLLPRFDLLQHLAAVQTFIGSGMLVHLAMAAWMAAWGLVLLRQGQSSRASSRGWILLVMPCPVCITVILLSSSVLMVCFPAYPLRLATILYGAFMGISILAAFGAHRYGRLSGMPPQHLLGGSMLLLALYFLVSVNVMPQFTDLDKVYRMACSGDQASASILPGMSLAACLAAVFLIAFFKTTRELRRLP